MKVSNQNFIYNHTSQLLSHLHYTGLSLCIILGVGRKGAARQERLETSNSYMYICATAREYKTRRQALEGTLLFLVSFAPSELPGIAVVGCIVSVNHGVSLAEFVVVTGFPVDLVGRLGAFSDSRKWEGVGVRVGKKPRFKSIKRTEK